MAPLLAGCAPDATIGEILDDPLDHKFLDRLHEALPQIEEPGVAYSWAKHGVQQFARREAVRLGTVGARICSVSPA
jgi:hypothetical protein